MLGVDMGCTYAGELGDWKSAFFQAVVFEKFENRVWNMGLAKSLDGGGGYVLQRLDGKDVSV